MWKPGLWQLNEQGLKHHPVFRIYTVEIHDDQTYTYFDIERHDGRLVSGIGQRAKHKFGGVPLHWERVHCTPDDPYVEEDF